MTPELSIVVPAYNEEKVIKKTLQEIIREFKGQEVIVVSDGSKDRTADIVREFPNVRLIESKATCGKGASIAKGMRIASGKIIGFLDADGSFHPKDVKKLISMVGDDADCAIASKWVGKRFGQVGESTARKASSRVWNLLVRALLGLRISDTQAGAKFMKKGVFKSIDREFTSKGFEFDIELLYLISKKGYRIVEYHIPFQDVRESTFRYSKTPTMFLNLLRIWLNR